MIKLLKSFYSVIDDNPRRIDITTRLVLRMLDEDESVRDLSVKTIEELWFPATTAQPSATKSKNVQLPNVHDKAPLLSKVTVIMGTAANFKDRQSPLEDVLHKIMAEKNGVDASSLHARYAEICETLVDGLVDASDLPGFVRIVLPMPISKTHFFVADCHQLYSNYISLCIGISGHFIRLECFHATAIFEECDDGNDNVSDIMYKN